MIANLETDREDLVAIRLTGTLVKEDYNQLIPVLESKINQFGKIDLYWEMDHADGWEPAALWEDIKFDIKHINSFRKVAIVGDKKWEELIANLIKPFTTAEISYFDTSQKEEAFIWVGLKV
ncbi:STAS/SEC14 domain-containing protein [Adhaeribacter aquaticus]|uniref:STAS/SEC14 domain-containing protein n=1 Tax=Adhaeribacter aquaticus TaxID=299567 RepID=UPI000425AEF2|nr:STAS/SEC14 domain-containing protein [Adhaeribacter aquaticus]